MKVKSVIEVKQKGNLKKLLQKGKYLQHRPVSCTVLNCRESGWNYMGGFLRV